MAECVVCGASDDLVDHHVSYDPPETVPVCRSCHTRIHKDESFRPGLTPGHVPEVRRFPREREGTTVQLGDDVYDRLTDYADKGETYSEAVGRLLNEAER